MKVAFTIKLKQIILVFVLFVGSWLVLWDIVDYLTTGLNENVWNAETITNAYPSIFVGAIILFLWAGLFRMRIWR